MERIQKFQFNGMPVNTIRSFAEINGGLHASCKEGYFVRMLGINSSFVQDVQNMDAKLQKQMEEGAGFYNRISKLPGIVKREDMEEYLRDYEVWCSNAKNKVETRTTNQQEMQMLADACLTVEAVYFKNAKNVNNSMRKNLIVKLLFWYDFVFAHKKTDWTEQGTVKIVLENISKNQEYLFCYLLTLMGCDVLLLQMETDISVEMQKLQFSEKIVLGAFEKFMLLPYKWKEKKAIKPIEPVCREQKEKTSETPVVVHIPDRNRPAKTGSDEKREKSFEELALLASSVVMITVHDKEGEIICSGSGIMVGKDGYILTNNHVAKGGYFYSVRLEGDDQIYETDEIIKYHTILDLALLRIHRQLNPLSIYQKKVALVRGQKVVAIGSPFGLFNSVSDGIISGFRTINGVDMIQFTAPISSGSSGGALLNMYGEVIGVSTAGIDDGQNINLAVGYETIRLFLQGFIGGKV